MTSCRFHGQAWSKTCQECSACLDRGAGPETIDRLVGRASGFRSDIIYGAYLGALAVGCVLGAVIGWQVFLA